jgi:hypothetical protein
MLSKKVMEGTRRDNDSLGIGRKSSRQEYVLFISYTVDLINIQYVHTVSTRKLETSMDTYTDVFTLQADLFSRVRPAARKYPNMYLIGTNPQAAPEKTVTQLLLLNCINTVG